MIIHGYLNDIFPANMEINDKTGRILGCPEMTGHWINHDKLFWFFEIIATIKAMGFQLFGYEPMFVFRICKKDKQKLKEIGITLLPYENGD